MKKIIILLILLGVGLSFLFLSKEKTTEIIKEEPIPKPKREVISAPPPNFLPEEEKPLQKPYLGPDFQPINAPSGNINISNKISSNLEDLIRTKIINPEVAGMSADVKKQGTFILVKIDQGLFVEQILVNLYIPGEEPRSFNAFADAETGEIIHTVEPLQASYSSEELNSTPPSIETPDEERTPENSDFQPSDSEMSYPVEE